MTFRRLAALFTSACLLHLSVAAGDSACATNGSGDMASASMPHEMAMSHHDSADAAPAPSDTPVRQTCCDAQAGCSIAGVVAAVTEVAAPIGYFLARPHAPPINAPTSFASPPEPPPPKA